MAVEIKLYGRTYFAVRCVRKPGEGWRQGPRWRVYAKLTSGGV